MNSIVKGLIIGGAIAVLGAVIAITALAVCGWTVKPKFQMKTFTSAEEVSSVYVRQDEGSVKLSYYDGESTSKFSTVHRTPVILICPAFMLHFSVAHVISPAVNCPALIFAVTFPYVPLPRLALPAFNFKFTSGFSAKAEGSFITVSGSLKLPITYHFLQLSTVSLPSLHSTNGNYLRRRR